MSVRSMTGFARVRRAGGGGEVLLTVKSVNHRGLDLHFHMSSELEPFEQSLRATVKERVARGHLDVRLSFQRSRPANSASFNRPLLESFLAAFRQAAADYGLSGEPDLNAALRLPGMLGEAVPAEADPELERLLVGALQEALDALNAFREREGAVIAASLRARNAGIRQAAARMEELRARALPAFQSRLNERLAELLGGAGIDAQRLVQEAAMLADRSDIGEEVSRLRIHADQVDQLLAGGGEIGKKLDFLLQEMNRETNTVLSKTTGTGELGLAITDLALAVKSDVDKIREQALNLE